MYLAFLCLGVLWLVIKPVFIHLRVFFALSILIKLLLSCALRAHLMPATSNLTIDSLPLAFGIIMAIIGLVFYTQGLPGKFWRRFYAVLPGIVLVLFYTSYFK